MMLTSFRNRICAGLWLCLVLVLSGCGERGPTVVPVKGIATHAGKPVANLHINFLPEFGRPSWAVTDAAGRFEVQYDREQNGAVLGKHKVFVKFQPTDVQTETAMQNGTYKHPADLAAILKKYGNMETSPKTVEITASSKEISLELD